MGRKYGPYFLCVWGGIWSKMKKITSHSLLALTCFCRPACDNAQDTTPECHCCVWSHLKLSQVWQQTFHPAFPFAAVSPTTEAQIFKAKRFVLKTKMSGPLACWYQTVDIAVARVNGKRDESVSPMRYLLIKVRFRPVKTLIWVPV